MTTDTTDPPNSGLLRHVGQDSRCAAVPLCRRCVGSMDVSQRASDISSKYTSILALNLLPRH